MLLVSFMDVVFVSFRALVGLVNGYVKWNAVFPKDFG